MQLTGGPQEPLKMEIVKKQVTDEHAQKPPRLLSPQLITSR